MAEEEVQVDPQALEDPLNSSTNTSPTLPYSSNSPGPFPPSPVHPATDSPIRVSPLIIAIDDSPSNNSPIPVPSTSPVSTSSQIFTFIPPSQFTDPSNNSLHTSHPSSSIPPTGPIVFTGSPPEFPYLGVPLSGTSSIPSGSVSFPSYPIPSMIVPAKPTSLLPIELQPTGFRPYRRWGKGLRGAYFRRGRVSQGRRGKVTSTTSCQISPIPGYIGPGHEPSLVFSRDPPAGTALNLTTVPRTSDYFPSDLSSSPLHYDYYSVLRAASPVVVFHCHSSFTQKSFSSAYSVSFPYGQDSRPLLVAGINQ